MKERIASYSGSTMAMYLIWQEEQPLDGKSRVSIDHTLGTRTCGDYEDSQSQPAFSDGMTLGKNHHMVYVWQCRQYVQLAQAASWCYIVLRQQHVRFVVKKITHTRTNTTTRTRKWAVSELYSRHQNYIYYNWALRCFFVGCT